MDQPRTSDPSPLIRIVDPGSGWTWLLGGLLLLVQVGAWVLATPVFGGPDEPAHTFWAAAVAGGDISGREPAGDVLGREVTVPASIAQLPDPGCFAFHPDVPAGCGEPRHEDAEGGVDVVTRAGRYPPAYYAVSGLPLRADAGAASLYWARAVSALLVVAVVVLALWSVRHRWDEHLALGVAVALTPMVLFVFAIINPNALEVAGNLAFWLAGLALVRVRDRAHVRRLAAIAALGAVLLALSRPASALWVALTGAVLLLVVRRRTFTSLVRMRAVWAAVAATVVGAVVSVAWLVGSGFLSGATTGEPSGLPTRFRPALIETFLRTDDYTEQLFGMFGWLDTPAPGVVPIVWLLLVGLLVLLALVTNSRFSIATALIAVALPLVPAVLEARVLGTEGFVWQGRYTLPLAVGLPIVAAVAVQEHPVLRPDRLRALLGWVLVVAWGAHVVAFAGTLRRYTVGINGPYPGLTGPGWAPPVDGRLLTVAFAAAAAAFGWWIWASAAVARSERRDLASDA
ncbi:MAG: DUF2142 domain-containing protein [Actinobacteria bacterium]|nr:DUF2142 domain-containing protein [Actinomycetota bacterium]